MPSEVNLSMDCEFLSVTSFDGTIKIIKMPAIIDPIQNDHTETINPTGTIS